jgi:transposase InsO family protein
MKEKCPMQENEPIEKIDKKKANTSSAPRGGPPRKNLTPTFEQRLRAVKLHLEEGFTQELIGQELGVSTAAVYKWCKRYREQGEEGLKNHGSAESKAKLSEAVRKKILELKKEEPARGIKRISQLLKRAFFLQASPPTVRKTLQAKGLMKEAPPKAPKNMVRPRFFERATPNQMWQTDIFTFRLGGRYAYVIAFMDDYSRFIVGADLFRSHTAENVLEVFRVAAGEYQPPKEMLTDNGREYVNWRGTTRFQAEMKKNGTHHFKSRPHHPMTLGKIERFWETIWQEFLSRAQFESFESARERIRFWIRYYNHKRPHQGIEGLCPADRFFEIASELRKTIETGIKENLLEMALRGEPKAPFYMVGRMEGQSVILRAEKGKLKLSIDNGNENKELVYDLKQSQEQNTGSSPAQLLRPGESPSGALGVDGAGQRLGSLPTTARDLDHPPAVAGTGDGGNASGAGTASQPGQGSGAEPAAAGAAGQAAQAPSGEETGRATGADPACQSPGNSGTKPIDDSLRTASEPDTASQNGPDHGPGSSPPAGHLPPGLLQVGEAWPQRTAQRPAGPAPGPTQGDNGPGEGPAPEPGGGTGTQSPAL